MPRKKRSKYQWVHKDYVERVARTLNRLAYNTAYVMRKHGEVDTLVIRKLGQYKLDDPVMPELYDTLNLYHNMHGEQPGPQEIDRLYMVIKERMHHD